MWKEVITRFAPSPTGSLHIGGARTALFNWLYARKFKGKFLLRIEDTDAIRSSKEAVQTIIQGLQWLNLHWDNSIIYQKDRFDRHKEIADILLKDGKAYKCYSSREEIEEHRAMARRSGISTIFKSPWRDRIGKGPKNQKFVVRLKAPEHGATNIKDQIMGNLQWKNDTLDDLIILRQDSSPTYMLAVVVDDHDMNISHIIRGNDHLTNSARQLLIYKAMNWNIPEFAHLPLIHGADGTKLSKRHGALSILEYQKMGFPYQAITNYLAGLGCSDFASESFSLETSPTSFSLSEIGRSPSRFDLKKLENVSKSHIISTDLNTLTRVVSNFIEAQELHSLNERDKKSLKNSMYLLRDRSKTYFDIYENFNFFLKKRPIEIPNDLSVFLSVESLKIVRRLTSQLGSVKWNEQDLETKLKDFTEKETIKYHQMAQPLRVALTGSKNSPSIASIMTVLGKEETLARLSDVLK
ncbi:MAG: glutamate--tRNA ligase [Pseudomonadota bacterium]|nr:glutamate--tRNA ligase [Pseudomonadota bacterium]